MHQRDFAANEEGNFFFSFFSRDNRKRDFAFPCHPRENSPGNCRRFGYLCRIDQPDASSFEKQISLSRYEESRTEESLITKPTDNRIAENSRFLRRYPSSDRRSACSKKNRRRSSTSYRAFASVKLVETFRTRTPEGESFHSLKRRVLEYPLRVKNRRKLGASRRNRSGVYSPGKYLSKYSRLYAQRSPPSLDLRTVSARGKVVPA